VIAIGGAELEYDWIDGGAPELVFLHEGLGSVSLWRSFPADVAAATGRAALVYSRAGYGRSSVVRRPLTPRYLHDEAVEVLPAVLERFGIDRPVLVGHSDGASIAIVHAGVGRWPVAGLVLLAPHVFVEEQSVEGIEAAREAFHTTDMRERMAKHHTDPDATFRGWNDVWLSPAFRDWNIEEYLPAIDRPILQIQGTDDPFGTKAQLDSIARRARGRVQMMLIDDCGHAPHLEHPDDTIAAVSAFIRDLS
jgi:pimeloyl-ACP methyl ester carboxylesterase